VRVRSLSQRWSNESLFAFTRDESMNNMVVFLSQFTLSLILYSVVAKYIFWDYAKRLPREKLNALLLIPHAFRLLGLLAIVKGVAGEALAKTAFASEVAYGDALVAPLAVLSMWLWLSGKKSATAMTWVFSIVASLDLANALLGALTLPVYNYDIGAFWIVLTYVVPLLVVTQAIIWVQLAVPSRSVQVGALRS
jgi:hypothetical protein